MSEQPRWANSLVEENGKVHYGQGLPGAICGNHHKDRTETTEMLRVTCPECLKAIRKSR